MGEEHREEDDDPCGLLKHNVCRAATESCHASRTSGSQVAGR